MKNDKTKNAKDSNEIDEIVRSTELVTRSFRGQILKSLFGLRVLLLIFPVRFLRWNQFSEIISVGLATGFFDQFLNYSVKKV